MCAHVSPTDSRKHISVAEEVAVHPVLGPGAGPWRARQGQDQHGVRGDQTGQSSTQDSSDADGGAVCFRPVLPAHQRAQCHEKVIISQALLNSSFLYG